MIASGSLLVIGEALIDIVRRADGAIDESPGGSPANVALALGRLGHSPTLLTRLGDDARGRTVRDWLQASDVRVVAVAADRTATATAVLDSTGAANYEFDIDWVMEHVEARGADIVHTGSIAAVIEPGAGEVVRAIGQLREQALITFDPNVRPALLPDRDVARQHIESLVALADVVKASDEDLRWLYPEREPLASAAAWRDSGPALVVMTEGGAGASALTAHVATRVTARRVDVVDTVGAGDTFMAAMIDALIRLGVEDVRGRGALRALDADQLDFLLRHAAHAASVTVSRPGADPPWRTDLESLPLDA